MSQLNTTFSSAIILAIVLLLIVENTSRVNANPKIDFAIPFPFLRHFVGKRSADSLDAAAQIQKAAEAEQTDYEEYDGNASLSWDEDEDPAPATALSFFHLGMLSLFVAIFILAYLLQRLFYRLYVRRLERNMQMPKHVDRLHNIHKHVNQLRYKQKETVSVVVHDSRKPVKKQKHKDLSECKSEIQPSPSPPPVYSIDPVALSQHDKGPPPEYSCNMDRY